MGSQPPHDLHELSRRFAHIVRYVVECRCGRTAEFCVSDLSAFWKAKKWSPDFGSIHTHFRCTECGRKAFRAFCLDEKAPDVRPPSRPATPVPQRTSLYRPMGIDPEAWARAQTDQERKRLIRQARG